METTEDEARNSVLSQSVLSQLVESVKAISESSDCCNAFKKACGNLVRRVKLLSPLFEELMDVDEQAVGEEEMRAFESLRVALGSTKDLLVSVNHGSKLYQVPGFFFAFSWFFLFGLWDKKRKGEEKL